MWHPEVVYHKCSLIENTHSPRDPSGGEERLHKLLEECKRAGVSSASDSYHIILHYMGCSYLTQKKWHQAFKIGQALVQRRRPGVQYTDPTYKIGGYGLQARAFCRQGLPLSAVEFLRMVSSLVSSDVSHWRRVEILRLQQEWHRTCGHVDEADAIEAEVALLPTRGSLG